LFNLQGNKNFGQYLNQLRRTTGMKQCMLASLLHVSPGAISSWETGKATPTSQNLAQLADIYGIEKNELIKKFLTTQEVAQQEQIEMAISDSATQSAEIKNNGMVQKTFLLPAYLNEFLEGIAAEKDISFGTLVRNILRQYESDHCQQEGDND